MPAILPYLITALLYGLLGVHFWRTRWRPAPAKAGDYEEKIRKWEKIIVLIPLALHGALLYQSTFTATGFNLGVGNAVSAILWLTVLIYWTVSFFSNLEGLQALVLPLAAVCVLLPLLLPTKHILSNTGLLAFPAHFLLSMLAYSLFTIAALHAVLTTVVERRLHNGTLPAMLHTLPPLLTMETLLFRVISAGFVLLTLALVSGMLFSQELLHQPAQFTHKTLFAFISWGIFAALLGGRKIYGWRGRTAMRWTWAGFIALVLAYVGSSFVLEVILRR
ncbi:MAG TPA: cytochrome c biogenesis protein CcsA [Burkholderiales bacterium]|nr:cytochrome c biogenesis protein CcsA [Burkholderiales bacterium]